MRRQHCSNIVVNKPFASALRSLLARLSWRTLAQAFSKSAGGTKASLLLFPSTTLCCCRFAVLSYVCCLFPSQDTSFVQAVKTSTAFSHYVRPQSDACFHSWQSTQSCVLNWQQSHISVYL